MDYSDKISLFRTRDYSENFETAFAFIKQNYGAICKGIVYFLPLIIIAAFIAPSQIDVDIFDILSGSVLNLLSTVLNWLGTLGATVYTISYMFLYIKSNDGVVSSSDVWDKVKETFTRTLITEFVYIICITIGVVLCLLPGVFIAVSCLFYAFIVIHEDEPIIDALKSSYYLVQGRWWTTFSYCFISIILAGILSFIFMIPETLLSIGDGLNFDFLSYDVFTVFTSIISYSGSFFISPILIIIVGMLYYSYRNEDEGIDLESTIDELGRADEKEHNNQY